MTANKSVKTLTATLTHRDGYGMYIFKVDTPEELSVLKSLESKLEELFPETYLPVWTADDYGTIRVDKFDSKDRMLKLTTQTVYKVDFKILERSTKEGKQYLVVKLTKNPKLLESKSTFTEKEVEL